ncbi:MAG: hypothetical protein IJ524_01825 [Bacteroidales bacterium]|nr:hypothetical protein [Bacteroidales bacterium]
MKPNRLLLMAAAALLLAACDPSYNEEYIIDNQSSHDLTFIWGGGWRYYPYEGGLGFDGSYPVPAGRKVSLPFSGDMGHTSRSAICASARYGLLGDSVSFVVDGTDTLTFHASDTLGADSPYNFDSPRYTFDGLPSGSELKSWASLTFRVDDAMLNQ